MGGSSRTTTTATDHRLNRDVVLFARFPVVLRDTDRPYLVTELTRPDLTHRTRYHPWIGGRRIFGIGVAIPNCVPGEQGNVMCNYLENATGKELEQRCRDREFRRRRDDVIGRIRYECNERTIGCRATPVSFILVAVTVITSTVRIVRVILRIITTSGATVSCGGFDLVLIEESDDPFVFDRVQLFVQTLTNVPIIQLTTSTVDARYHRRVRIQYLTTDIGTNTVPTNIHHRRWCCRSSSCSIVVVIVVITDIVAIRYRSDRPTGCS
jgi:hypothetical protein